MSPQMDQATAITRRQLLRRCAGTTLAVGAVGALTACGSTADAPSATTTSLPADGNLVYLDVAASERNLIARYTEIIAAHPQLAPRLQPLLQQHEEHLAATGVEVADPPALAPPSDIRSALGALRQAELTAAAERRESCQLASEPEFVRTLTFIAASEASHIAVLKSIGEGQ